uniref:IlGF domain-containing protein n=1 Tax=Macrostomum lignano TaxID=282301 RepID=A0A1I8FJK1_9PLAT
MMSGPELPRPGPWRLGSARWPSWLCSKLCSKLSSLRPISKKLQTMRSSALTLSALVLLAVALCGSGSQQIRTRSGSGLAELYEVCKDRGGVYNGGLMRASDADTSSSSSGQLLKRTIGHSKPQMPDSKDDIVHHCCHLRAVHLVLHAAVMQLLIWRVTMSSTQGLPFTSLCFC